MYTGNLGELIVVTVCLVIGALIYKYQCDDRDYANPFIGLGMLTLFMVIIPWYAMVTVAWLFRWLFQ